VLLPRFPGPRVDVRPLPQTGRPHRAWQTAPPPSPAPAAVYILEKQGMHHIPPTTGAVRWRTLSERFRTAGWALTRPDARSGRTGPGVGYGPPLANDTCCAALQRSGVLNPHGRYVADAPVPHGSDPQIPVQISLLSLFTRRSITMRFLPALVVLFLCTLGSVTSEQAVAQALTPERETPCDAATASAIPLNENEGGACARRTYALAPASALMLRQENYGVVEIDAWDGSTIQIETTVVARQATQDAAQADLRRITLNQEEMGQRGGEALPIRLFASGPDRDAPGYWTVRYRLRVPAETMLDIRSKHAGITVRDVVGAHRLESTNGTLTYRLPSGADGRVELHTTNGIIEADASVGIRGTSFGYLKVVVGRGKPATRLTTTNGNVRLRKTE